MVTGSCAAMQQIQVAWLIFFQNAGQIDTSQEVRADQYGIRSVVTFMGSPIRFEIVLEGRISFDQPSDTDKIYGVQCLTVTDLDCQ